MMRHGTVLGWQKEQAMTRRMAAVVLGTFAALSLAALTGRAAGAPTVYTVAQATAGQAELHNNAFGVCSDCHTNALTGRVGADDELPALSSLPEGQQKTIQNAHGKVPPLVGSAFLERWGTRSTKALTVDFQKRFAPALSEETRLNIIAYLLQLNGATPGTRPFTMETDVQIAALVNQL
jgi:cytochrome c1